MARRDIERAAEVSFRGGGDYALSGWSIPGLTARDIATRVGGDLLPHAKMRQTTVGALRRSGLDVVIAEPPRDHVEIRLGGPVNDDLSELLEELFNSPEPNPVALPKGANA